MLTGVEVGLYGLLPDMPIGSTLRVRVCHLDSDLYWRPDGSFGEQADHVASVVADDGHWRLMLQPMASGSYSLAIDAIAADGSRISTSSSFNVVGEDLIPPIASAISPQPDAPVVPATAPTAASQAFWDGRRGIGFSVDSQGAWTSQERLESALQEVVNLGFDTIRTWGTNVYTQRILAAVESLNLDLKLQAGIYINGNSDAEALIDQALSLIEPHKEHVLGISLGNEQLADWNSSALTVSTVREHVQHLRNHTDLPITYNFAGETFRPGSSFWDQQGAELLKELDYVNVHSYAGFFDNRWNPDWTPQQQLEVLIADEALFRDILDNLGLHNTPLILGETGWQGSGYANEVTNTVNMQAYFNAVHHYVSSESATFDGMFYFNFSDEAWKGGDDHWGLFNEGDGNGMGDEKFDASLTTAHSIVPAGNNVNLRLISDSGSARLLVDDTTGRAYVQQAPLLRPETIERADDVLEVHMRIFSGCDLILARPTVEQLPIQESVDGRVTLVQHWDSILCSTPATQTRVRSISSYASTMEQFSQEGSAASTRPPPSLDRQEAQRHQQVDAQKRHPWARMPATVLVRLEG